MQIVRGQQHRAEDLAAAAQMVQIGAAVAGAGRAAAFRVERRRVVGMARIAQVQHAPRRVKACAVRPERVGNTQSNMSIPRMTAPTRSAGLPTPIR